MSDEEERTVLAVRDALATAMPGMILRWVVVAEAMDESGERATWCITDPSATAPDVLGLLGYALLREQAGIVNRD